MYNSQMGLNYMELELPGRKAQMSGHEQDEGCCSERSGPGCVLKREWFEDILRTNCQIPAGSTVIIACSGGADSIALLALFRMVRLTYPLNPVCVHIEHGIRGAASRDDAAFVEQLCREWQIPFRLYELNVPDAAMERHAGIEATAREMRYSALKAAKQSEHAVAIAVAHHRRDQAETILMHMMRGCGTDALAGMQWRENGIIRPFLQTDPEDLRVFLREQQICWREDLTNSDTAYTRNRVRHCVLPEMEKAYPGTEMAMCRLGQAAARDRAYFSELVAGLSLPERALRFPAGLALPSDVLRTLHPAVSSRAIVELIRLSGLPAQGRDKIEAVLNLLRASQESAENLEGGGRARLWRGLLILVRQETGARKAVPLCLDGQVETVYGTFSVHEARPGETGDGRMSQVFPADCLKGAVITSVTCDGRFQPFGRPNGDGTAMSFLTKVPLPAEIRERLPVVADGTGEVLWIPGVRPSERARGACDQRVRIDWDGGRDVAGIVQYARGNY